MIIIFSMHSKKRVIFLFDARNMTTFIGIIANIEIHHNKRFDHARKIWLSFRNNIEK